MESQSPISSLQSSTAIPNEIYNPLLQIAQHGYDAHDVKTWYLTVMRHLRRIGMENVQAAYRPFSPTSNQTTLLDPLARVSSSEDTTPTKATFQAQQQPQPQQQPQQNTTLDTSFCDWSESFSFDPFQDEQLHLRYSSPAEQIFEPALVRQACENTTNIRGTPYMSANWSPSATSAPEIDVNEITASTASEQPVFATTTDMCDPSDFTAAANSSHESQWFSPEAFDALSDFSSARSVSISPFSTPAMSYSILPTPESSVYDLSQPEYAAHPPLPTASSLATAVGLGSTMRSTEFYFSPYAAPISVIPSRKRRKLGGVTKGVKKIMQPLQNRQHSI